MCTTLNQDIRDRFESSGLTRKAFAAREGMAVATLAYHLKRARSGKGAVAPAFTELELPLAGGHMEITTSSGTVVRIPL